MDKNRALHELLGLCWHEFFPYILSTDPPGMSRCTKCKKPFRLYAAVFKTTNPDYAADPRLVLREMRKREDWRKFCMTIGDIGLNDWPLIKSGYVMDTTGKLTDLAIKWLKEKEEGK